MLKLSSKFGTFNRIQEIPMIWEVEKGNVANSKKFVGFRISASLNFLFFIFCVALILFELFSKNKDPEFKLLELLFAVITGALMFMGVAYDGAVLFSYKELGFIFQYLCRQTRAVTSRR